MNNYNDIKKEASYNFFGNLLGALISAPLGIILVRYFLQSDYGIYRQIIFISIVGIDLLRFNFHKSLFYFYPAEKHKNNKSLYISQTYSIMFAIGIIFLLIALFFQNPFSNLINFHQDQFYTLLIFLIFLGIIQGPIDLIFIIENNAKLSFYYRIIYQIIRCIIIIISVIYYGTISAVICAILSTSLINTIFAISYLKIKHRFKFITIEKSVIINLLKYNSWFTIAGIFGRLGNHVDKIILLIFINSSDFAIYSLGNMTIPFLGMFYTSIGDVVLTQMSKLSVDLKNKGKIINLYNELVNTNFIHAIPVIFYTFFVAKDAFILTFGIEYELSARIFIISNLILLIQPLGSHYILRSHGITKPFFWGNLTKFLCSITIGPILIFHWSLLGAAIAYFIANVSTLIIQLNHSQKVIQVSWGKLIPWKNILLIFFISSLPLIILHSIQTDHIAKPLFLIISGVIYFPVIYCSYKWWGLLPKSQETKYNIF